MVAVSDQERVIRQATVERARELFPTARIIHELNVEQGVVRADVAAVTEDRLILFEIKSQHDTLHRLSNQIRLFHPVCHALVIIAHEKWCGPATDAGYPNCDVKKIISHNGPATLWQWPEPEPVYFRHWSAPHQLHTPWHHRMLRLLWTEELRQVARNMGVEVKSKTPGYELANRIAAHIPGRDIEHAVCAALRTRPFAWADEPMGVAA